MSDVKILGGSGGGTNEIDFAKLSDAGVPGAGIAQGIKATTQMAKAVRDGDIKVTEEFGTDLQKAITEMQEQLAGILNRIRIAGEKLPLGGHEYAHQVADHTLDTIAGESNSALTSLRQLRDALEEAAEALESAKKQYAENEDSASQAINIEVD